MHFHLSATIVIAIYPQEMAWIPCMYIVKKNEQLFTTQKCKYIQNRCDASEKRNFKNVTLFYIKRLQFVFSDT